MGRGQGSLIRARFEDVLSFIKFTFLFVFKTFSSWNPSPRQRARERAEPG